MFARRSKFLGSLALVHDSLVTALAFLLAYRLRLDVLPGLLPGWHWPGIYSLHTYWPVLLATALGWPLAGYALGIYRDLQLSSPIRMVANVVKLVAVGLLVLYAGLYVTKSGMLISRSFILLAGLIDVVLLIIGRWLFFAGTAWIRERLGCFHAVLIVGTGPRARGLANLIEEGDTLGMRLVGFVGTEGASGHLRTSQADYPVIPLPQVLETLRSHVIDEVIFAVNLGDLPQLEPLIRSCAQEGVNTRLHLEFLPSAFSRIFVERLRDVPLLSLANTPEDSELLLFLKRVFDLAVSAAALVVLSPALLVIALLVKLTSPGPVLYRQIRSGLNGRRFTLYKFRSMVDKAEELRASLDPLNELNGPVFKISQDPRCTPVGRWLRRFSFDELPQLWNVFLGEMSFVGPRPALPGEVEQYEPWQRRRLRMRPGLTCTWVLEGRNQVDFQRLIQLDLSYIDNWSLWLDLKISLMTIPLVLSGRGAY